jgi:hypothetical protein
LWWNKWLDTGFHLSASVFPSVSFHQWSILHQNIALYQKDKRAKPGNLSKSNVLSESGSTGEQSTGTLHKQFNTPQCQNHNCFRFPKLFKLWPCFGFLHAVAIKASDNQEERESVIFSVDAEAKFPQTGLHGRHVVLYRTIINLNQLSHPEYGGRTFPETSERIITTPFRQFLFTSSPPFTSGSKMTSDSERDDNCV